MTLTVLVTMVAAVFGSAWLLYRFDHIVVTDAVVRGRVHRVGARLDGQVRSIEVEPAQRVRKGDVLVQLEDDFQQATVRQCQSELQSAVKRHEAEKLSIEHDRLRLAVEVERAEKGCNAARAEVQAAYSILNKWEAEFDRVEKLSASQVASASQSETVLADRNSARALVLVSQEKAAAAESNCRVALLAVDGLRVRQAGLEVLAAEVERERQRLAAAQADLDATVIHAPEAGWVAGRTIEPGGSVRVGEPVLSLWIGAPWVEAWVNEKHLFHLQVGSPVDVTLTAFPGNKLKGRVEAIGVLADKELQWDAVPSTLHALVVPNARVPVRIAVQADHLRLQPGLSALVGINHRTNAVARTATRWLNTAVAAVVGKALPKSETAEPFNSTQTGKKTLP